MTPEMIKLYPKITLEAARVNAHLSQKEAAQQLGITPQTLASYERGTTLPDVAMGKKIERLYAFPLDLIFFPGV